MAPNCIARATCRARRRAAVSGALDARRLSGVSRRRGCAVTQAHGSGNVPAAQVAKRVNKNGLSNTRGEPRCASTKGHNLQLNCTIQEVVPETSFLRRKITPDSFLFSFSSFISFVIVDIIQR